MKELSIEERAQRYDEAIERAVNIRTGKCETTFVFTEGLFNYLFPELEECNGEEVRKAMIDFFKHEREEGVTVLHYGVNIERMIAWLEKQGQVNETIISQHENKTCKENNDSLTSEEAIQYLKENHSPSEVSDFQTAMNIAVAKAYDKGVKDGLEKQGEQKPADRVKPMFKVGDWIIYDRHMSKVKDMDSEGYLVEDTYGDEGILPKEFAEKHYHLWTIAEAKDGDVLADNVGVILFKSIGDNNVINFHAYFSGLFAVQEGEHYWGHVRECTLSPATKEQRERFYAAMHDAGYEWDAEKKELKKIKDEMEIPFGAKDSELQEATYFIPQGFHAEIDDDKVVIKKGEQNTNHKTMIGKFICKKDWHGIGDYYYGKIYNGYPCKKEQKGYDIYDDNHIPTFCDEDFIDEYFDIVTEEKQVQNHTDEEMKEALRTEYEKGRADAFAEMQKEWSEEDDDNMMMIEDRLRDYLDYIREDSTLKKHIKNSLKEEVSEYIDWLKSIKQRIGG